MGGDGSANPALVVARKRAQDVGGGRRMIGDQPSCQAPDRATGCEAEQPRKVGIGKMGVEANALTGDEVVGEPALGGAFGCRAAAASAALPEPRSVRPSRAFTLPSLASARSVSSGVEGCLAMRPRTVGPCGRRCASAPTSHIHASPG